MRHWSRRDQTLPRRDQTLPYRGRPCQQSSVEDRRELLRYLCEVSGVVIGLEALRALFPQLPRCVLEELLRRARRVWRARYRQRGFELTWQSAGRVWAIDFSEATQLIDGVFSYLFAVRDLASHCQLAWCPMTGQTADEARGVLAALFHEHGPPLVLKSDNGSAFIADAFQELLAEQRVLPLFSPARRPQYNGALERSNGTLKVFTQQRAAAQGHPHRWTADDVESARDLANRVTRPWGHAGQTPDEAWHARSAISDDERETLRIGVAMQRVIAREELGVVADADESLSRADQARVDRLALSRVLQQQGYLQMRRADRAPRKPKRLSRAELAELAAAHFAARASALPAPTVETIGPTNLLPDLRADQDAPRAVAPASPPASDFVTATESSLASDASEMVLTVCQSSIKNSLASPSTSATMPPQAGVPDDAPSLAGTPPPAQREPVKFSWLRRSITPLIQTAKAAIFS